MAKALTAEARDKKVAAQEKVVARLIARRAKAEETLKKVEKPLQFERARLEHLKGTPIVDDETAAALAAAAEARAAARAAAVAAGEPDPGPDESDEESDEGSDEIPETPAEQDELTFA